MNYRTLQPGLERRLSYARELRQRSLPEVVRQPNGSVIFNQVHRRRIEELDDFNSFSYEVLSELKNVNVGLIHHGLVDTKIKINLLSDNFCVICQELISTNSFDDKSISRVLKCSHCFHIQCIDTWFINSKCCPTCKKEVLVLPPTHRGA